jgi:hypothetical protein
MGKTPKRIEQSSRLYFLVFYPIALGMSATDVIFIIMPFYAYLYIRRASIFLLQSENSLYSVAPNIRASNAIRMTMPFHTCWKYRA